MPDEEVSRNSFEVFFPGAQWVGDGMRVPVMINGKRFDFNLELIVDAYSGAFVGASIRDEEDSRAVVEAFEDGVETTGAIPLALLLDNRSSNHAEEVDEALGEAMRMRGTLGRPQNKAHIEGGFGLFSQHAPPLDIDAHSLRELAKEILRLRVQTFARSLNHRPRRDRSWQSRADIYRSKTPAEDEVAAARAALEEQRRKRERAMASELHRADPITLRFLDDTFVRLGIVDPDHHARRALARYGRDIVLEAVAIFEGKASAGTLPDQVDAARYILGIARNIDHVHEADHITQALLRNRVEVGDALLAELRLELSGRLTDDHSSPKQRLHALLDCALGAERTIDQLFWIDATGTLLSQQPTEDQEPLFRHLARRIHTTFALRPLERATIERRLARIVWPVN
ncbi:MAG: integrase catalytic domain-containing protein [Opitutales bacterium]